MHRCSLHLAAAAAITLCLAAAPRLAAQSAAPPELAPDSIPYRLTPVEVRGAKEGGGALGRLWRNLGMRAEFDALRRENRALGRQLRQYDRRIAYLEAYRDSLKASLELRERRIAMLDSATAATRARRMQLEEQVRVLEARRARSGELIP